MSKPSCTWTCEKHCADTLAPVLDTCMAGIEVDGECPLCAMAASENKNDHTWYQRFVAYTTFIHDATRVQKTILHVAGRISEAVGAQSPVQAALGDASVVRELVDAQQMLHDLVSRMIGELRLLRQEASPATGSEKG